MVCDYYIERFLEIEHINGITKFELQFHRQWFPDIEVPCYESDDEYDDKYFQLIQNIRDLCLTAINPRIVFEQGKFVEPRYEDKYMAYVNKLVETGTIKDLNDIKKITKKEIKYEQYRYFEFHTLDE